MSAVPTLPSAGTVTMFSTAWCGYSTRLKATLNREGIAFNEIDIEQHPAGADFVMSVNGGNRTVPTLVFPDGSTATNPSVTEVQQRLAA